MAAMTEDERAIRRLVDRWMTATKAGDVATVLSLMADDVVFMVPGREPFGKEEFRAAADQQKGLAIDGSSEIVEVEVFGEWAFMRTRLTVTMTPQGSKDPVRRSGYTLTILRKDADGNWLLARDANLLTTDA
jgi:uncharacterized protein (TIGR02246 family)